MERVCGGYVLAKHHTSYSLAISRTLPTLDAACFIVNKCLQQMKSSFLDIKIVLTAIFPSAAVLRSAVAEFGSWRVS